MYRPDRHSRWIARLKVLLPLAALALLSTLFLISRAMDGETVIPFAENEVRERLRDQQVTGPFFSGVTSSGDEVSFSAVKLTTPEGETGVNIAENVVARLNGAGGSRLQIVADRARVAMADNAARLDGDVIIRTSQGYVIRTEVLDSELSRMHIEAPEPLRATGPLGDLQAGGMTLDRQAEGENAQMLFTDGVKLVYTPK
ncbi:LPS export ABC transporter periplasmic protein LptC [Sulfitobacter sp. S190]|uniref:LPS export ABC transporter periplasmic protein LptC n=1 Tax=Sulfitobacter sp. S190 TaxID=2867022 RepID=UPI0021A56E9C|nr:LPS export ABC transporter periplasmic protein LptC [Sulfitobacter sp. S190]UWR22532.1 LPS export ABC transporter periplasmic protein LptC [Sulfitobacter sp. S190]